MLVETIQHGKAVFDRLNDRYWTRKPELRYFAFDTETQPLEQFPVKKSMLVDRRHSIRMFSICVMGEPYSFVTSNFSSEFPTELEWARLLHPYFTERTLRKVMHNANYDLRVSRYRFGFLWIPNIWDTMIGAWKASEFLEKGLKARSARYGRFLTATKNVDFTNKLALAAYAEQDVVATDEIYQMQLFGVVRRPKVIVTLGPKGLVSVKNPLYSRKELSVEHETLSPFDKLWLSTVEFPVLRSTMRAQHRGFPFDVFYCGVVRHKLSKDLRESLRTMYKMVGRSFNPGSPKDLKWCFTKLGLNNPFVTKKGQTSFDAKAMVKMQGMHSFVDALQRYKALSKLYTTYTGIMSQRDKPYENKPKSGLEYFVNPDTGSIHTSLGTVSAITGRSSSSTPNLQQIPARKDIYRFRDCFCAVPRWFGVLAPRYRRTKLLIDADMAQLEIRVDCLYSKDANMTEVLSDEKGDIHQFTADQFSVTRQVAKSLNFLMLYGGGAYMLSEALSFAGVPTTVDQADAYLKIQEQVYPGVTEIRKAFLAELQSTGKCLNFFGRSRTIPDIRWSNGREVHKAETVISNNLVQSAGQDLLKASIIRMDYQCINPDKYMVDRINLPKEHCLYLRDKIPILERYRRILKRAECQYILQVHDELIFTVLPEAAEECCRILVDVMTWRHYMPSIGSYSVPLVAEGGCGNTWKKAKSDDCMFAASAGFDDWRKYQN